MAKVNWSLLKTEYISDESVSYEKLAKKYSLNVTTVAERGGKEKWPQKRKLALIKADQKTIEKTGETLAEFNVRKLRQGRFVAGRGLQGIKLHRPKTAREAKELFEVGMRAQTEAMGADKPQTQVNIQNNFITMTDFVKEIEQRVEEEHHD